MEIVLPEIDEKELKKIKNECFDRIIKDELILDIIRTNDIDVDFIKRHLYYFSAYLNDHKICSSCPGPSICKKKNSHLCMDLTIDKKKDSVSFAYRVCKEERKISQVKKKFWLMQFENQCLYYSFKDCLKNFAFERHDVVKKMIEFVKNPTEKGIYLSGDIGTGKSFILKLFSVYLAKNENTKSIIFVDCENEFKSLENCYNTTLEYFNFYLDQFKEVQYLFLDDLGKEFKNDFVLSSILLPVVEYRLENHLPIFISSDYSLSEIKNAYSYISKNYKSAKKLADMLSELVTETKLMGMPYSKLK